MLKRNNKMDAYEEKIVREYMTLSNALKLLPNVVPNLTKQRIKEAMCFEYEDNINENEFRDIKEVRYYIGNTELTREEWKELWIEDLTLWGCTIRVSPKGAKILIRLYKNGDLTLKRGKAILQDTTKLTDYANKEIYYQNQIQQLKLDDQRKRYLLEHPEEIQQGEFTYNLLNELFIRKFGLTQETHTLVLDNIKITKQVTTYKSNSGKTSDSIVVISWIDLEGNINKLEKASIYQNNRRNDEKRNWGLPE